MPSSTSPLSQRLSGRIGIDGRLHPSTDPRAVHVERSNSDSNPANTAKPRTQDYPRASLNVERGAGKGPKLPDLTDKAHTPVNDGAIHQNEAHRKDLSSLQEAKLLQHYVARLGPWVCLYFVFPPMLISSSLTSPILASISRP